MYLVDLQSLILHVGEIFLLSLIMGIILACTIWLVHLPFRRRGGAYKNYDH